MLTKKRWICELPLLLFISRVCFVRLKDAVSVDMDASDEMMTLPVTYEDSVANLQLLQVSTSTRMPQIRME